MALKMVINVTVMYFFTVNYFYPRLIFGDKATSQYGFKGGY